MRQVIDSSGAVLFSRSNARLSPCSEGLIVCEEKKAFSYLDKEGNEVFSIKCTAASPFKNGLATVLQRSKIGFINKSGAWQIEPAFEQASDFHDGFASVEFPKTRIDPYDPQDFGFIDDCGLRQFNGSFEIAEVFSEGLAPVCTKKHLGWQFIDTNGSTLIGPIDCDYAHPFTGPLAMIVHSSTRHSYINRQGECVWKNR